MESRAAAGNEDSPVGLGIPGYMDFGQGVFVLSLLAEPYFNMQ